jgi:hypothetical protein
MKTKNEEYNRKRPTIAFRVNADVNTVLRQKLKEHGVLLQDFFENLAYEATMLLRAGLPPDKIKVKAEPEEIQKLFVNPPRPPQLPIESEPQPKPFTCPICGSSDFEERFFLVACKRCGWWIEKSKLPRTTGT